MTPRLPQIMAILNLTPDSFSDGGEAFAPQDALKKAESAMQQGAEILDIGAESTRPGASPLEAEEEWQRLEPVLRRVVDWPVQVSLDTRHAITAARGLELGVDIINDVSGGSDAMLELLRQNPQCRYVLTHSLSVPAVAGEALPEGCDPLREVAGFFLRRVAELEHHGIKDSRIILDPGIGFGKSPAQNWHILRHLRDIKVGGLPLLLGHSRKSFLPVSLEERDTATLALSLLAAQQGVDILRVHAVAAHHTALQIWEQWHVRS